jgi:hypothetical protein
MNWGLWTVVMAIVRTLNRLRFTSTASRTAALLALSLACVECGSGESPEPKPGAAEENVKEMASPLTTAPPNTNLLAPLECLGPSLYNIGFGTPGRAARALLAPVSSHMEAHSRIRPLPRFACSMPEAPNSTGCTCSPTKLGSREPLSLLSIS